MVIDIIDGSWNCLLSVYLQTPALDWRIRSLDLAEFGGFVKSFLRPY